MTLPRRDKRNYEWPVDQLRRWVEIDGMKHHEIAARLGVNPKLVSKACARFGIRSQRRGPRSGHGHPEWKGGIIVDKNGYILVWSPGHPMARGTHKKYVLEHRLVMAECLGRLLLPNEVVHHRNGDKQDNRIENLELYGSNAQHLRDELTGRCPNWTEAGKERIRNGKRLKRESIQRALEQGDPQTP